MDWPLPESECYSIIWWVVNRMAYQREDRDELFQVGAVALMSCLRLYREQEGKFSTYLFAAVKFGIINYRIRERRTKIRTITFSQPYPAPPRKAVIVTKLFSELSEEFIRARAPTFARETRDDTRELCEVLTELRKCLCSREDKIIDRRHGGGLKNDVSLEQVAIEMGVSKERIRQIEARALRKLKRPENLKRLESFRPS